MRPLLLLLAACSTDPPAVSGLSPAEGPPGTSVVITGSDFAPGTTAKLGGQPLDDAVRVDEQTIRGAVPGDLDAGPTSLVITDGSGRSTTMGSAFTVQVPVAKLVDPCGDEVKIFSRIPATADQVLIDRHLDDGEVDRQQIPARKVEAIEYEIRPTSKDDQDAAASCHAIWVRTNDGQRHLFDASDSVPLRKQAQDIANGLGKPVTVVRSDSEEAEEAEETDEAE